MLSLNVILRLESADLVHLLGACAAGVELVAQPLAGQLPRQLDANDALAHAQHLRVVALDGALDGEGVVGGDGADALDLVGGDGDAQARAADHESAVRLAFSHETGGGGGAGWVGSLVVAGVGADVDDLGDARVGLEVGLDLVLVAQAGLLLVCQRLFSQNRVFWALASQAIAIFHEGAIVSLGRDEKAER